MSSGDIVSMTCGIHERGCSPLLAHRPNPEILSVNGCIGDILPLAAILLALLLALTVVPERLENRHRCEDSNSDGRPIASRVRERLHRHEAHVLAPCAARTRAASSEMGCTSLIMIPRSRIASSSSGSISTSNTLVINTLVMLTGGNQHVALPLPCGSR